ncbi:MAG: polymer-forming cytoskeletal protein [Candidatus Acidiferrales bacterium]
MWKRTEELKPSAPGANAAEPAAVSPNFSAPAATRPETVTSFVPAAPIAPAFAAGPATAADVTSAINSVSTISAGLKIRGEISGDCHLIIEGETHGKIHLANGRVTVAPSGRVTADIAAPEIVIEGNVQGNLQARDNVRMGSASHVQGSVLSPRIRIEDGASFRGKVEMTKPGHSGASSGNAKPAEDSEVASTAIVGTQRG